MTTATLKLLTFKHGVHPEEYKELTSARPIERMPFGDEYVVHLSQHLGKPSHPIVRKGQRVARGEVVAEADGFVSIPQHAPVAGTVKEVGFRAHPNGQLKPAVVIVADPFDSQRFQPERPIDLDTLDTNGFVRAVQASGMVGLGGAAFPTHVKFAIPEGKHCRYLMINACECEPFLTADHRTMVEQPDQLFAGIAIASRFLEPEKIYIGIEANKPDAYEILRKHQASEIPLEIIPLQVKYPQGAEKMLIAAVLKREVPAGKLPLDVETLVSNVETMAFLGRYFTSSQPLIERVVTVTGPGIVRPANLLVPVGTSLRDVIDYCGGLTPETTRLLLGGPMMGVPQKNLDVPVTKGTSGILALTDDEVQDTDTHACIRCGRCLEACPVFLNPSRLGLLARKHLYDEMEQMHVMDCMECASCSFVCPSGIPLVQQFRAAKTFLRQKRAGS